MVPTNSFNPTVPTLTNAQPPAALFPTLTMKTVVPVMLTTCLALLPYTMALPLSTELQLKREADPVASPTYPRGSKCGPPPIGPIGPAETYTPCGLPPVGPIGTYTPDSD